MNIRFLALQQRLDNAHIFAYYALNDLKKWERLIGLPVCHKSFGKGKVTNIETTKKGEIFITIYFDDSLDGRNVKRFMNDAFVQGFFTIEYFPDGFEDLDRLRDELAGKIEGEKERISAEEKIIREREMEQLAQLEALMEQKKREARDVDRFFELKKKYLVEHVKTASPTSPLYMILLKLEDKEKLSREDIQWLEDNIEYAPLAIYYESEIRTGNEDPWLYIRAGKYWRKANDPQRALDITEAVFTSDPKVNAAIQTNRGGAYRDLKLWSQAKDCATKAMELDPNSYHSHNLMGAICYQMGQPEEGDTYFEKAIELGAPPQEMEFAIRKSLKSAEAAERHRVVQYLLWKDPEKFDWANYYL